MEHQKDVDIAVLMVSAAKRKFDGLFGCSFDKGFYSPGKREELRTILDQVVLPKKGKLSKKDKQTEHSEEFIESRRNIRRLNRGSMRLRTMPWIDVLIMGLMDLSGMLRWRC